MPGIGLAVSWGAIVAGAVGAAALSLVLLLLGSGLGLASMSPWTPVGASAATLGVAAILWLSFTQIAASGLGGYVAGRLRTRWPGTQGDEVFFRDTAHGFLAWALASVLSAGLMGGAISSVIGTGTQVAAGTAATAATAMAAGGAAADKGTEQGSKASGLVAYFTDSLMRPDPGAAGPAAPETATVTGTEGRAASDAEAGRILTNAMGDGTLASPDAQYLSRMVAQRTGMPPASADRRVTDTFTALQAKARAAETSAREAADKARKAAAFASLWMVVALLLGAFVASLAATYGGRNRDTV